MTKRPPTPDDEAPAIPDDVARAEDRLAGDVVNGHAAIVLEHVRPEWMFGVRQKRILERAAVLMAEGREVDLVTICEGQTREAMLYASTIIDASHSGLDVRSLANCVRRDWRRREAVTIGRELANGASQDQAGIGVLAKRLSDLTDDDDGGSLRFSNRAMTFRDLLTRDIPPLKSLLGRSLMVEGGMSLVIGASGLGKTFLALQLMRAIAEGTEFLEMFWTDPDGRRVGLLELEMPEASIRGRAERIGGEWVDDASILCMQDVTVDLIRRETQDEIIAWIKTHQLAMLVMDPVNALHSLDENKSVDMALLMSACKRIKAKTGVHLVLLHHVNKTQYDVKAVEAAPRTVVLSMVRGSGRLNNDPDNIFGLLEAPGGRIKFVFAKTRHSESPADVYLRRNEHGFFEKSEAVQTARANESNERIGKYLLTRHTPATLAEIAKGAEMSESGVKKRLVAMGGLIESTQGRPKRYALSTSALTDQCDFTTDSETTSNGNDF